MQIGKKRNLCKLTMARSYAYEILKFQASWNNVSFSNDRSREVTAMKYVLFQVWLLKWNFLKGLCQFQAFFFDRRIESKGIRYLRKTVCFPAFPSKSLGIELISFEFSEILTLYTSVKIWAKSGMFTRVNELSDPWLWKWG